MSLKNLSLTLLTLFSCASLSAQPPIAAPNTGVARVTGVEISYTRYYNDKESDSTIELSSNNEWCAVKNSNQTIYLNLEETEYFSVAELRSGETIATAPQPLSGTKWQLLAQNSPTEHKWECSVYKVIGGNEDIEIWATSTLGFWGTPLPEYGCPKGELVLRVYKDGEMLLDATKTDRIISVQDLSPKEEIDRTVSNKEYNHARIYTLR